MKHRDLVVMAILLLCTFGFYFIYWAVSTKNELNRMGAHIPTGWLIIIPFANFYFWYKYAQAFGQYILKNDQAVVSYFLLLVLLPPVGMLIVQSHYNALT